MGTVVSVDEERGRYLVRNHDVEQQPGFESFQLLRPIAGGTRYFVVSTWADEDSYQAWRTGQAGAHHGDSNPVATGAELLEFETSLSDQVDGAPLSRRCWAALRAVLSDGRGRQRGRGRG